MVIIFKRPQVKDNQKSMYLDGVELIIEDNGETKINDLLLYFTIFLEALTYPRDMILEAMKDFAAGEDME